ncbi:hypothetical protein [Flammeovirga aprica]|uniref:Uncharacterized protein n=1 Tax=Flammeovirga aprica JL-4 TaxID=694437 RepID=A0A7X9RRX7_9BACT|nr:hypothetical protein [Flammeovirga aprica]NME66615.1 hypothetical protein [Flammeovirga aprica JL-4]
MALLGVVVFMEFEGVEKVTYQNTVDRTQLDQDKALQKDLLHQLAKIGTSRRWQDVESKRLIAEQLEEVKIRIQYGLKRFEAMEEKAETKAQQFRLFSLIFIGLSLLASSCIRPEEQENIKPVLKPVSKAFKNENEEEENQKPKQVYKSIDELGTKQRIALAVEHINKSKQCKFSYLMKEFRLSPKQVKEAKQLSNYEGKEEERRVIGF